MDFFKGDAEARSGNGEKQKRQSGQQNTATKDRPAPSRLGEQTLDHIPFEKTLRRHSLSFESIAQQHGKDRN